MSFGSSISWLWSQLDGPYTPTEILLILSSAASTALCVLVETLSISSLRQKTRRTRLWLRYMLYTTLSANVILAFDAYLTASHKDEFFCGENVGFLKGGRPNAFNNETILNMPAWNVGGADGSPDSQCARRAISRWLSLLISVSSTILLVSAWLDFREEDRQESQAGRLGDEPPREKDGLLISQV
ncbi:hypothetical protein GGR52DRAFT_176454 [Hypoxylon sp. FL1284]|nr:hypothetical protein GGR52DRAFT_176454 [Hypoxylon sp. FL1284]